MALHGSAVGYLVHIYGLYNKLKDMYYLFLKCCEMENYVKYKKKQKTKKTDILSTCCSRFWISFAF